MPGPVIEELEAEKKIQEDEPIVEDVKEEDDHDDDADDSDDDEDDDKEDGAQGIIFLLLIPFLISCYLSYNCAC